MANGNLGVIGGGVMGEAILSRLIDQGIFQALQIIVSDPQPARREFLEQTYGVRTTTDNALVVVEAATILLAIKPQMLDIMAQDLRGRAPHNGAPLGLSILAGIPLARLEAAFPGWAMVRAMPNTPALSGSGPGYVALMVEALADGGVAVGLPRATALKLAIQTLKGTAELLQQSQIHPGVLKDRVTSPGGTTIAGIAQLEAAGLRSALIEAVRAAHRRSVELGQ
jgi:pyrroline-5-carboxylate reductase